jgi:hypothetical protein
MLFLDEANPTPDEIRRWAAIRDAQYPCEDWDIIIACEQAHDQLFFDLANDSAGPNRLVFLHILYLIVGDALRTQWRTRTPDHLAAILARGNGSSTPDIRLWVARAAALIANPCTFRYEDWCGGSLARTTGPP